MATAAASTESREEPSKRWEDRIGEEEEADDKRGEECGERGEEGVHGDEGRGVPWGGEAAEEKGDAGHGRADRAADGRQRQAIDRGGRGGRSRLNGFAPALLTDLALLVAYSCRDVGRRKTATDGRRRGVRERAACTSRARGINSKAKKEGAATGAQAHGERRGQQQEKAPHVMHGAVEPRHVYQEEGGNERKKEGEKDGRKEGASMPAPP